MTPPDVTLSKESKLQKNTGNMQVDAGPPCTHSWNACEDSCALLRGADICRERIKECLGMIKSKLKMMVTPDGG